MKKKIKIIVASGKDLKNFEKILKGEKFKGTILI
jgi:uridylate kinase